MGTSYAQRHSLKYTWPLLVLLFLFNVGLLTLEGILGQGFVGRWISGCVSPALAVTGRTRFTVERWGLVLGNLSAALSQQDELRRELLTLREHLAGSSQVREENQQLRQMLGVRQGQKTETLVSRVIGCSSDPLSRFLLLDSGVDAGVERDMPVLGPDGRLLGRIDNACVGISRVTLTIDRAFSAGVSPAGNDVEGMLSGDGRQLVWRGHRAVALAPGTALLTSANSWLFPPNLTVGHVIGPASPELSGRQVRDYLARPSSSLENLAQLRFVLIVLDDRAGKIRKMADVEDRP